MARRGRPEHKPTKASRDRVAISAGGGMAHEDIALAMGLSRNTLEKHYERELSIGAAEKRHDVMKALFGAAKKGKVAAIKEYLASAPQLAAPPVPKQEKPGKKVMAQAEAADAARGTDWHEDLPRHDATKH